MPNNKDNIEKLMNDKKCQFRKLEILNLETRTSEMDAKKNELIIEGRACVFNKETVLFEYDNVQYKEQIDSRAFDKCDMTDVILNYNHNGMVYARTRNKTLNLEIRQDGLYMTATLNGGDLRHKQLFTDIQSGLIDRMSFAFTVRDSEYDSEHHSETITDINKLYDVSAVAIPAYDETEISARRAFDAASEKRKLEQANAVSKARALFIYEKAILE